MTTDSSNKTSLQIATRITESILAKQLAPGTRLGEQQLADLFGVSRTLIREALMRLAARGIVQVSARRGWYVIEPTAAEAREAFEARRVIELGLLRHARPLTKAALDKLHDHIAQEQSAISGDDVGARSYLLGDFHVCLCECLGNNLLSDTLRDLTARTTLTAMLRQSSSQAVDSCEDHVHIVDALERGDIDEAERLMLDHLQIVESTLYDEVQPNDPLNALRTALTPVSAAKGRRAATQSSNPSVTTPARKSAMKSAVGKRAAPKTSSKPTLSSLSTQSRASSNSPGKEMEK
ncbi:GntR family transcriptional regulator [Oxalicibacterium faecigallinarum]|uniref:GntR family transcriptional regulator n=1 Tax=Oxalicibacterium faecigallinarum TaxID=573741 RepID=A0A8J3ARE4_9BURK|nr:GntR family transcriptional regulator [Oxalicibacterium faecigallinarum]GGI19092.1 GntR family transcriptional regulator [Oxalicibacterium faecigallinarum]